MDKKNYISLNIVFDEYNTRIETLIAKDKSHAIVISTTVENMMENEEGEIKRIDL